MSDLSATIGHPMMTDLPPLDFAEAAAIIDGRWMRSGACGQVELDFTTASEDECKEVCRSCPEQLRCLRYALLTGDRHYVIGNTSPAERRVLDNGQRYSVCIDCGAGFLWIRQSKTPELLKCSTCNNNAHRQNAYTYGATP